MNYGQRSKELLLELKRSEFLPPYNGEVVRAALEEINLHFEALNDQFEATRLSSVDGKPPMESRPSLLLHNAAVKRNKRCLLAYHHDRLNKLKMVRWDTSATLPPDVRSLLSETEIDFFKEYDNILDTYNSKLKGLSLNANLQPPEEDLIEIRVVKSGLGTIVTDMGNVSLELGTTHFLSRDDVEHLIRQGAVVQLDNEETC